jgi:hypothetical protein
MLRETSEVKTIGSFPFGEPVNKVVQMDRSPKEFFVLGVYASAVHARWISPFGKTLVNALAVASEPYIFWRGEDPVTIIKEICIPTELGRLEPARSEFNGPSGIALDKLILHPLGIDRNNTWLCDLVPHSCVNPGQRMAIEREYLPLTQRYQLPTSSVPPLPKPLVDDKRIDEIVSELMESKASKMILLGDLPIKWFLRHFDKRWHKLSDFEPYGQIHHVRILDMEISVLPLAHPRQIARLGRSSSHWYKQHQLWVEQKYC